VIYTAENCKDRVLVDATGTMIPGVQSWNDETSEVTFILMSKNIKAIVSGFSYEEGFELVKATAVIKGARLLSKEETEERRNHVDLE
jgi:hypothetical protein